MKLFLSFIFMMGSAFAGSEVNCHLVNNGIYINSPNRIENLKFGALVDNFSLVSAKDFSIEIDGQELKFLRKSIDVSHYTKMVFLTKNRLSNKAAIVQIDRTPRKALKTKEFFGNVIISPGVSAEGYVESEATLTYNFYCSF